MKIALTILSAIVILVSQWAMFFAACLVGIVVIAVIFSEPWFIVVAMLLILLFSIPQEG